MNRRRYETNLNSRLLLDKAREEGCDIGKILSGIGCREDQFNDRMARIDYVIFEKLFLAVLEDLNDPALGVHLGLSMKLAKMDVVGFAVATAGTVLEAMRMGFRLHQIASNAFTLGLVSEGGQARFSIQPHVPDSVVTRCMTEFYVVVNMIGAPRETGVQINPTRVRLSVPEPPYRNLYEELFDCPIEFSQDETEIYFDSRALEQPQPAANPAMNAQMNRQATERLQANQEGTSFTERVRDALRESSIPISDLTSLSKSLGLSPRTIQARLKAEGMQFRELRDEARMNQAMSLLNTTDHSVEDIAYQLGFSDFTSFYKAFRRWTGSTPRSFIPAMEAAD